jgi:16S rRNA (guanine1207-N2)-methyltransferase
VSGPAAPPADDPVLDPGVLMAVPTLEFHGTDAVHGGVAVLPWRTQARTAPGRTVATAAEVGTGWQQAVVRIQKGRAATTADLAAAWQALAPGGALLVAGGNDLGITSWQRRLADWCGAVAVVVNRGRGRVLRVVKDAAVAGPPPPGVGTVQVGALAFTAPPGVFSADALDPGSALLLAEARTRPGDTILDPGCGIGVLSLPLLAERRDARACLLDADARAVAAACANAAALGLEARAAVHWWEVGESLPETGFALAVCNPPAHAGTANDFGAGAAMLRAAHAALAPGGTLLAVANRQLPYERLLADVHVLRQEGAFKLLELRR